MPAYRRSAVVPYLYDAAWETANVIVSQALVVGRGVYRDESGSRCSSISIETAAIPATAAHAAKVSVDETLSSSVPSVGTSARPTHHESPIVAI